MTIPDLLDFDSWFAELQSLTFDMLDPNEWRDRWGQRYTPDEAMASGPEDGD